MFFQKKPNIQWLVVGLGNPGDKYENTRHNIGFMVADALAESKNLPIQRLRHKALTQTIPFDSCSALLMKPITYMNLSGEAVRQAADYYNIPPERILVLSDEVAFPIGTLKISKKGSAGGHNGLKNIIHHLGTQDFPRIRVGVGDKPHPDYDMADWVLGKFTKEDKIQDQVERVCQAVTTVIDQGFDPAMAKFHGNPQKKNPAKRQPAPPKASPETAPEISSPENAKGAEP